MSQPNQNDDQRNATGRAEFFRALANAHDDGLPMPFQVYFGSLSDSAQLRYRSAEDVDTCVAAMDGTAVHDSHSYEPDAHHADGWHGYGTPYAGGKHGHFAGLSVEVWVALEGPAPTTDDGAR